MSTRVYKTKGIVLRSVKYGETSLIVSIMTELFGLQTYMVNGVRKSSKKGAGKANLFQPSSILNLVVYHNEMKQMQRIKEFSWGYLYKGIQFDIKKNTVALFMVELLQKCLKQPEPNTDMYNFVEDSFIQLDESNEHITANFPLFFALHLPGFFGVPPTPFKGDTEKTENIFFDLEEGGFSTEQPNHVNYIEGKYALVTAELLMVRQPDELAQIKLNHEFRRALLYAYETYYRLHFHDFGTLKTLPVLQEILS